MGTGRGIVRQVRSAANPPCPSRGEAHGSASHIPDRCSHCDLRRLRRSIFVAGHSPGSYRPRRLTAAQAAADLCAGKITSKALTSAALARAKAIQTSMTSSRWMRPAHEGGRAFDAGREKGACKPLGGVPIVIKDNIEVAGLPASAGRRRLKGYMPRGRAGRRKAARGRRDHYRQDQHARTRLRHFRLQRRLQDRPRARRAQRLRRDENRRRLVVGNGRRDRRADRHRGSRHRYRRIGAHSLRAQRLRFAAADCRTLSRRTASRRSPTPAIPPVRWHPPWRTSRCSIASSPAAGR